MSHQVSHVDTILSRTLHNFLRFPYLLHAYIQEPATKNKPATTVVLLHGMGDNTDTWEPIVRRLPKSYRVISLDLLGHGQSPAPQRQQYNVAVQARAVAATLLRKGARKNLIVVGHSMGALVATELAKRQSHSIRAMVLCSPPLYPQGETWLPTEQKAPTSTKSRAAAQEKRLIALYTYLIDNPDKLISIARRVRSLGLLGQEFSIDDTYLIPFIASLRGSIINQTATRDLCGLHLPFTLIHGRYDPVVIRQYLRDVAMANPQSRFREVYAQHGISAPHYARAIVQEINHYAAASK